MKRLFGLVLSSLLCTSVFAIGTPNLSSPSNGSTLYDLSAYMSVSSVSGATGYQFQYDTVSTFTSPHMRLKWNDSGTRRTYSEALLTGQKYYWRARAFKPGDTSSWSSNREFTVNSQYTLAQPPNGSSGPLRFLLGRYVSGDVQATFIFEYDTTSAMNSPAFKRISQDVSYFLDTALFDFGQTIYWRGTVVSPYGDTLEWSDTYSYTSYTKPSINSVSTLQEAEVNLVWPTTISAMVKLQYDTLSDFSSPDLQEILLPANTIRDTLRELRFGKKYYVRLRAELDNKYSEWTDVINFQVRPEPYSLSPSYNTILSNLFVNFSWNSWLGCETHLQLFRDTAMTDLLWDTIKPANAGNSLSFPDTLRLRTKYFWRIRHQHARDTSPWVNWNFTTYGGQVSLSYPGSSPTEVKIPFKFWPQTWATGYILEVDTGKTFGTELSDQAQTVTQFTKDGSLMRADVLVNYGSTYTYRIYSIRNGDTSEATIPRVFTTTNTPVQTYPSNDYRGIGTSTSGSCKLIIGTDSVEWQLDTSANFDSPEFRTGKNLHEEDDFFKGETDVALAGDLLFEARYYWRARFMHSMDTSNWTTTRTFTTTQRPWNTSPANMSTNFPINGTIDWGVQGSNYSQIFQYQVAKDSFFVNTPVVTLPEESFSEAELNLDYFTRYYWRGRAVHSRDTSRWTPIWQFHTIPVPTLPTPWLASPANNTKNVPQDAVDLLWFDVDGANEYEIQVADNANFNPIITSAKTPYTGVVFRNMASNKTYYWRVRAWNSTTGIKSDYSVTWKWTTVQNSGIETTGLEGVMIFPNPAKDVLHVETNGRFDYTLINALGQVVSSGASESGSALISVADFAPGLYRLVLMNEAGMRSSGVVIE